MKQNDHGRQPYTIGGHRHPEASVISVQYRIGPLYSGTEAVQASFIFFNPVPE
jgi:hypothetical protein